MAFMSRYTGLLSLPIISMLPVTKQERKKIDLNHTRRYNLLNNIDRTEFIKAFVALLCFVAAEEADVGFYANTEWKYIEQRIKRVAMMTNCSVHHRRS